jgi:hypothetical protein
MIITFVDAGVLIAAARGHANVSAKAMAILDDPNRSFASRRNHRECRASKASNISG